ncbi:MAG: RagB/SusD family nutrient uptake outer membrane protein [Prevotella pectinovora]|uniref:RagB/SusD family nutrient uptake outer membrane protein n=1 Tax=Prevotella pectinovora TaxID=1602169 RepID=UPI002E79835E|nr:RagB/SusD family nutrient uptake outer membrane protein [Prevotella pectinovora]MEE1547109.1 RagB/SusD family nutrient uptake outer membrane protein [Prevotella pectinovora]
MKKFIIMSALGLATVAGLSSCSDFLDTDNKSTVTPESQFSDILGWNQQLNNAYYALRDVYSDPKVFCQGTDLYTVGQNASAPVLQSYQYSSDNEDVTNLYKNTYAAINYANCVLKYCKDDKLNDQARFVRDYCYYILTQQFGAVPYITDYIESASTNYPRTDLATVYANVIADLKEIIANGNLESVSSEKDARGRASVIGAKALLAKVYLAAGWDLQTTVNDAKNGTYTVNSTEYFAEAAKYASEVADAVPLTQSFDKKWDFDNNEKGTNAETLFAIQYDRATSSDKVTGGHDQQHNFALYMGSNTLGVKGVKSDLCPTERVYYAFDKGDDRFEGTFMTTVYGYDGNESNWSKQGYWAFYNANDDEKAKLSIAFKYFPWYTEDSEIEAYCTAHASQFVTTGMKSTTKVFKVAENSTCKAYAANGSYDAKNSATYTQPFSSAIQKIGCLPPVRKFDDKNTTSDCKQSGGDYRDVVVLNASEIYLVAAEAYLMMGDDANSLKYLNAVRTRSHASYLGSFSDYKRYDWGYNDAGGYVSFGQTDSYGLTINKLDVILDERMRETLGEYYRWMDLRRTHQLVRYNTTYCGLSVNNMTGNDGQIKWLRPIPENEIQINSGITAADQNPGFRTYSTAEESDAE